ncbi:MAG: hypothetical protein ACKV2T_35870 [Kofleriaceae bacterium]
MRSIPGDQANELRARLSGILAEEGAVLVVRVHEQTVHVTAWAGEHQVRLQSDLQDPDVELRLAAKLVCFVERVKHRPH